MSNPGPNIVNPSIQRGQAVISVAVTAQKVQPVHAEYWGLRYLDLDLTLRSPPINQLRGKRVRDRRLTIRTERQGGKAADRC